MPQNRPRDELLLISEGGDELSASTLTATVTLGSPVSILLGKVPRSEVADIDVSMTYIDWFGRRRLHGESTPRPPIPHDPV